MVNKRVIVGICCMLVGGILIVIGLVQIPIVARVLILIGGTVGFIGYRIYELRRNNRPKDLNFGKGVIELSHKHGKVREF